MGVVWCLGCTVLIQEVATEQQPWQSPALTPARKQATTYPQLHSYEPVMACMRWAYRKVAVQAKPLTDQVYAHTQTHTRARTATCGSGTRCTPQPTLVPVHVHGVRRADGDVGQQAEAVRPGGLVVAGHGARGAGMVAGRAHGAEHAARLCVRELVGQLGGRTGAQRGGLLTRHSPVVARRARELSLLRACALGMNTHPHTPTHTHPHTHTHMHTPTHTHMRAHTHTHLLRQHAVHGRAHRARSLERSSARVVGQAGVGVQLPHHARVILRRVGARVGALWMLVCEEAWGGVPCGGSPYYLEGPGSTHVCAYNTHTHTTYTHTGMAEQVAIRSRT